jgi:polyisoprenoid-binding protein YceI
VKWAFVAACAANAAPVHLNGQEFHVDLDADNTVLFISSAAIEVVEGRTDRIDGYIVLDSERVEAGEPSGPTGFYLEVDLASLDTGLGLRNRHMRNNYLEVKEFPYATFDGTIQDVERLPAERFRVWGVGAMEIHGVSREMRIPCDLSPEADGYRAHCSFEVLLTDFDIKIPKLMFLKLANEIRLELDFTVRPALDP